MLLIPIFTMKDQSKEQIQYQSILVYERWYKIIQLTKKKKKSTKEYELFKEVLSKFNFKVYIQKNTNESYNKIKETSQKEFMKN